MLFPTDVGGRVRRPGTGSVNPRDTQGGEVRTDLRVAGSGDGRPCVLGDSFWTVL